MGERRISFPIGDFCCNFHGTVTPGHMSYLCALHRATKGFFFLAFLLALPRILSSLGPFLLSLSSPSLTSECTANTTGLIKTSSWVILPRKDPHVPVTPCPPCSYQYTPYTLYSCSYQYHCLASRHAWFGHPKLFPWKESFSLNTLSLTSLGDTNLGIVPKEANGTCAEWTR